MRQSWWIGTVVRLWLLGALLSPAASLALPLEDHRQITLESLDAVVRPSPEGSPPGTQDVYRFTPVAAEQIANANRDMDVSTAGGWLGFALPEEHFEDGVVAKSNRRVEDLRREIMVGLMLADSTDAPVLEQIADRSRVLLGEALHTTQDLNAPPSSDYTATRPAAVKASVLFVQTLIAQLESAGALRSICAFLGREDCGEPDAS